MQCELDSEREETAKYKNGNLQLKSDLERRDNEIIKLKESLEEQLIKIKKLEESRESKDKSKTF